jgi:hypothetical protein
MSEPVLLIGIPSEPPLEMVAAALARAGMPYLLLNQRRLADLHVCVAVDGGEVTGMLQVAGDTIDLETFGGVYNRVMDHELLPELERLTPEDPLRRHADRVHEALGVWCELMPGRVVNRLSAQASNASKPYQAQLIADHFAVPETLVTSDPENVLAFRETYGRLVFKSISGARSIVRELKDEDLLRLDRLRWCPAQFQQRIDGMDIRVHTLADGQVFATSIDSVADDWRYSGHDGQEANMRPYPIEDELSARCLRLAASLGLDFAGIDLRISASGNAYCFEVNPSPAYSAFEAATGQPIALALAYYLAEAGGGP